MGTKNIILERACLDYGGQARVAKALGITQGAINQWVNGVRPIPPQRALELVELFGFKVRPEDLCADVRWDIARQLE